MLDLEDSPSYQKIVAKGVLRGEAKGKAEALRETILRLGKKKFGDPSPEVLAEISGIADEHRLIALSERILDAATWGELLAV